MLIKTVNFTNLNCSSCAEKIEKELLKLNYISSVSIDVLNQKLIVSINDDSNIKTKIDHIKELCLKIEPTIKFDKSSNGKEKNNFLLFIVGLIFFSIPMIFKLNQNLDLAFNLISYILIGYTVIKKAFLNIFKKEFFDENMLMTIATIGAFIIGEFSEAVAVMIFSKVGEFIQNKAINKSRNSITKLMNIKPDIAHIEKDNTITSTHPNNVNINDIIVVKPGERVPLDGVVVLGETLIDTKALTGEFLPKKISKNDNILSGTINIGSLIKIKVSSQFKDSTVCKILDMVENASSQKSKTENFITKFSKIYTPIVILISLIIALVFPFIFKDVIASEWLYRALVFLVVSCPCALVISIPLSFFSGIGISSKNGILIKGSNFLEALNNVSTVIFDKTGTITEGVFTVTKLKNVNCSQNDLLKYASIGESFSNHPISKCIVKHYNNSIDESSILNYEEIPGYGVKTNLKDGKQILVGNSKLMSKFNINFLESNEVGTISHIALNNQYLGYILIADKIKEDSKKTIQNLYSMGIKDVIMLTGDNEKVAKKICEEVGIKKFFSSLLPNDKVEYVQKFIKDLAGKSHLIFIGDGINDAPSLAIADIGISMGGIGSDAAIESSDIVIMNDEPSKIIQAIKIAKYTRKIAIQNIVFSLIVKFGVLILSTFGLSSMWFAILSDVGVSLIVILNSIRILNTKN